MATAAARRERGAGTAGRKRSAFMGKGGDDTRPAMTINELRDEFARQGWNVSRTRVWQLHERAIAKLRRALENDLIVKEYFDA